MRPFQIYMIDHAVQQMAGALAHDQVDVESVTAILLGVAVFFLSRSKAAACNA